MNWLTIIYLVYMFISLYFFFLFVCIYIRNKDKLFWFPKTKKFYKVSVIIPAYNEEDTIKKTLEHVFNSDYDLFEVVVVNDGSTDKTAEIVREMMKKYKKLKLINKKNTGKADSLNYALKRVKGELVVVIDSDSYVLKDAIRKMTGYFDDPKVGCVTGRILVANRETLLERIQALEYAMIAFTRKLLEFIEGIWVTPGALSMYRKDALLKVGGFNPKNLTEDVEITWRLIKAGYKIRMCLAAGTYTSVPSNKRKWWRQRIRWDIGGVQTLISYKGEIFKKNPLGYFIVPLFAVSMFLGLFGLSIFLYLWISHFILAFLYTRYSFISDVPVLTFERFYVTATVLNFFGIVVFLLGLYFTLVGLKKINPGVRKSFFNIFFYLLAYVTIHPVILAVSIYKLIKKDLKW